MSELAPQPPDRAYYAQQMPETERDWGFRTHELDPSERQALPLNDVVASRDEMVVAARQLAQTEVTYTDDASDPAARYLDVPVVLPVEMSGMIGDALRGHRNGQPLDITHRQGRQAIEALERDAVVEVAAQQLKWQLDDDFSTIDSRYFEGVENVTQIFEVSNGRAMHRIYNFTQTPLEGVSLQKVMNALQAMDQATGGQSTEDLSVLAFMPDDAPAWREIGKDGKVTTHSGITFPSAAIALKEVLLKHPNGTETPGDFTVSGDAIDVTLFHELTHLEEKQHILRGGRFAGESFGWRIARNEFGFIEQGAVAVFEGEQPNPVRYGRKNEREDSAETAAAMFVGGVHADRLDDARVQAVGELFANRHTGVEGPAYLTCTERKINEVIANGKIGTHLKQEVTFRPHFVYSLEKAAA